MLLFIPFFLITSSHAQSMHQHQWKNRVIILYANGAANDQLIKELDFLTSSSEEVTERDLVVYEIFPDYGIGPEGEQLKASFSKALREKYNIEGSSRFTFILIGKDGTVKLNKQQVVSMNELFGLIDKMPMRRAEMRQKETKSSSGPQH